MMAAGKQHQLVRTGSRAPDFRLPALGGGEKSLQEIVANGPALLAFFKVTCPVCQLAFPFLERLHLPGRLPIYGISQHGVRETREFNQRFGVNFPTLLDSEESGFPVSNAYGISSVPTLFLVERDGAISRVIEGWSKKEIQQVGGLAGVNPFRKGEDVPEWKPG